MEGFITVLEEQMSASEALLSSLSKDKNNVAAELLRVANSNKDRTKLVNNAENTNWQLQTKMVAMNLKVQDL
jgi:hypothetical protein